MDEQLTHWFRSRLLEQKDELMADDGRHGDSHVWEAGDNPRDLEDQASRTGGDLVESRLMQDRVNLLRKIEFALGRLDAGTFQTCNSCGGEIPLERLRAKPSASLCVMCQAAKDRQSLRVA